MKKLVLAYSGGLDTSYCAKYLAKEENDDMLKEEDEISHNDGADQDTMKKDEDTDASSEMDEKKDGMSISYKIR